MSRPRRGFKVHVHLIGCADRYRWSGDPRASYACPASAGAGGAEVPAQGAHPTKIPRDAFGVIWGEKLSIRLSPSAVCSAGFAARAPYCTCAALGIRELELVYPATEEHRLATPTFFQGPGVPFAFNVMNRLLPKNKGTAMPSTGGKLKSAAVFNLLTAASACCILAAQLGYAKRGGLGIQSRAVQAAVARLPHWRFM